MEQGKSADDVQWMVQVGPDVAGVVSGSIWGTSATFLLSPGGVVGAGTASVSTDAGANWSEILANQAFSVSSPSGNDLQWSLDPQNGGQVKFAIGGIA